MRRGRSYRFTKVRSPSFLHLASPEAMRGSEQSEVLGAWGLIPQQAFFASVYTDALLAKDRNT